MTSEERHEARYQRRKQKRQEKEYEFNIQFDNIGNISNIDILLKCAYDAKKSASWKSSTQKFHTNLLQSCINYSNKIINQESVMGNHINFTINERGKIRHITSCGFPEKVIQKAISQNVLFPIIFRSIIYDNSASIPDRGYDFAIERLKKHLHHFYNSNNQNNDGWVLLLDVKNFFGSINHDILKDKLSKMLHDQQLLNILYQFLDNKDIGLELGFETGQLEAVFFLSSIDHLIKDQLSMKYYNRTMDDSYIIHDSKEYLTSILSRLIDEYNSLGLELNLNKTKIVKLDSPEFKFLKNTVKLDEKGNVIIKPSKKSIKRERIKLGKFKKMYDKGEMSYEQINASYQSWRGFMVRKNCYYTISEMDRLFVSYFGRKPERKQREIDLKSHKKDYEICSCIQDENEFVCKDIEDKMNRLSRSKNIIEYNKK